MRLGKGTNGTCDFSTELAPNGSYGKTWSFWSKTMKTTTLMLVLAFSPTAFAGDIGIAVVDVLQTNAQTGRVYGKKVFTRNGQTNLIQITKGEAAASTSRIYHFYHEGRLVANFISGPTPSSSIFNTEAGPYCVSVRFGPFGEIQSARIGDRDGVLLDEFTYTNGVFSPHEGPLILDGRMKPQFGSQEPSNPKTH
jgi:hypothetical protein